MFLFVDSGAALNLMALRIYLAGHFYPIGFKLWPSFHPILSISAGTLYQHQASQFRNAEKRVVTHRNPGSSLSLSYATIIGLAPEFRSIGSFHSSNSDE